MLLFKVLYSGWCHKWYLKLVVDMLPLQSCSSSGPKSSWVHQGCKMKLRWPPTAPNTLQLNGVRQKRVRVVQLKGRTATTNCTVRLIDFCKVLMFSAILVIWFSIYSTSSILLILDIINNLNFIDSRLNQQSPLYWFSILFTISILFVLDFIQWHLQQSNQ